MKTPTYMKEGWAPRGPGRCRCPRCGATVSTNALARRAHERRCPWVAGKILAQGDFLIRFRANRSKAGK